MNTFVFASMTLAPNMTSKLHSDKHYTSTSRLTGFTDGQEKTHSKFWPCGRGRVHIQHSTSACQMHSSRCLVQVMDLPARAAYAAKTSLTPLRSPDVVDASAGHNTSSMSAEESDAASVASGDGGDSDNESLRNFAHHEDVSQPAPDVQVSAGAYAASVASSRNGKRRPPPPTDTPMTVPEFVAQLHVEDVKKRLAKRKTYLDVTPTKPVRSEIVDFDAIEEPARQRLSRYALTQRAGSQFRAAKSRHESRLREQTRNLAAAAHACMPPDMLVDSNAVLMTDDSGKQEKYYMIKDKEKHGGATPGLGAALDIVASATQTVLQEHAPDYVNAYVTSENVRQVLALIFREDIGARLMHEIENAVRDFKRSTVQLTDTVRLVDEETWRRRQHKHTKERKTLSSSAASASLLAGAR